MDMFQPRDRLTPPKGLIYTGSGDFRAVGEKYLGYFIQYASLEPTDCVLDVGSGIGRMAVPLTGFLSSDATYEGFDVVETGVKWCRKRISSQHSNFNFTYVGLANDLYRSDGEEANQFTFPYPDDLFNLVIVISVFTHMLRAEVEHYLNEIHRCLRPGGRSFVTCFLLNSISRDNMAGQAFRFEFPDNGCVLMDQKVKSANVAYDEDDFLRMATESNLMVEQVHYGKWSGRTEDVLDFQDIVIMRKPE